MKLKKLLKISDNLGITMYYHGISDDIRFTANDEVFASMDKVSDKIWNGNLYPNNTYTQDTKFNGTFKEVLKKCLKFLIIQVISE